MKAKLLKIMFLMSKAAIHLIIVCQAISIALATESDAQRRLLKDIQVDLIIQTESQKLIDLILEVESKSNFKFAYSKSHIKGETISITSGSWNMSSLLREISIQNRLSIHRVNETIALVRVKPKSKLPNVTEQLILEVPVKGKITDENGEGLPGATVLEKLTSNGTVTDPDGYFELKVSENATLVISFVGYQTQEVVVGGKSDFNIQLEADIASLETIVVTGFRGSGQRAIEVKRKAASVVEAISPADIGNFSDENIGDALRRVPGVQIQEDQSGGQDGGSRVSIRGIGPAFVQVTVNGRQPLSGGVEGIGRFRQFNTDVLPPEIIQGATIYKTSEAGLVEPGLAGLVNFQTIKPLSANYKDGRNFFGAVNLRGELDGQDQSFLSPTPRLSTIIGGKTKDNKLGAYGSILWSQNERSRDQVFSRISNRNLKEDTNNNGVWDGADGGDTEYLEVITPNNVTHNPIREQQKRLAASGAIEWKPTKSLSIIADAQFSRLDNTTTRALVRPGQQNNAIGTISTTKVFEPGSLNIVDNFLQSYSTAGAFNSADGVLNEGASILNQTVWYDNLNETAIGGLNVAWEQDGWKIAADYSLSQVEFNQIFAAGGRSTLGGFLPVDGPFEFDGSEYPTFTLGEESQTQFVETLLSEDIAAPFLQWNRFLRGTNNALKLDVSKEVSSSVTLNFGTRLSTNNIFVAAIQRGNSFLADENGNVPTVSSDVYSNSTDNFLPGSDFNLFNSWPSLDYDAYESAYPSFFNYTPGSHPLFDKGTDIFDAENIANETIENGTDEGWGVQNGPLFQVEERTLALYGQMDFTTEVGNLPVSGNFGIRGVRTEYTGKAFTTVTLSDPLDEAGGPINLGRVKSEVSDSQWDFLPSLNLNFSLTPNLNYRVGLVKTLTRPEYDELAPGGSLVALNTLNSTFDGTNGSVSLPNTALKPFTSWQIDNTVEWYNEFGGAVVFSFFYKEIFNYINSSETADVSYEDVLADGGFDTAPLEEAGVLNDFESQTYSVNQPENIGNAQVFGFEVGFNQPLEMFSDALEGFGIQANYNYVSANFFNDEINSDDAFPGTSKHNFNTVAYYENAKFGFRVAYNARSNYLRTLSGQGLTSLAQYTEGRGQLDLRANYEFIKDLQFSLAAQNITGADQRSFFRNNPSESFQLISLSPIYTVGLRYGF